MIITQKVLFVLFKNINNININKMILTDDDLHNNKYDETLLEKNINNLSLWTILLFQKVSANFCVKYFWTEDDKYAKDEEDCEIYLSDILHWQPHLTKEIIHNCDEYISRLK